MRTGERYCPWIELLGLVGCLFVGNVLWVGGRTRVRGSLAAGERRDTWGHGRRRRGAAPARRRSSRHGQAAVAGSFPSPPRWPGMGGAGGAGAVAGNTTRRPGLVPALAATRAASAAAAGARRRALRSS